MARQTEVPGTERQVNKKVAKAGATYVDQRDKRMGETKKEKEVKDALIATMREEKVKIYRDDEADPPVLITLSNKYDVKVTRIGSDDDDAGGEEETKA